VGKQPKRLILCDNSRQNDIRNTINDFYGGLSLVKRRDAANLIIRNMVKGVIEFNWQIVLSYL
jgi:hypothetical protein